MYRILSLLIGYVFGNFLTAEVVSHKSSGKSSFDRGSGNPGMANILSQDGVKYGALVLLGDLIKTFIPCLLCRAALFPQTGAAAAAYAGMGVVLGHDFPAWHRFKGGKGVACTCAMLVCISFGYGLLACIIGLLGVLVTRRLCIGAVLIPTAFIIPAFLIYGIEIGIIAVIASSVMLLRNLSGIRRIFAGTEPETNLLGHLKGHTKRML